MWVIVYMEIGDEDGDGCMSSNQEMGLYTLVRILMDFMCP